MKTVDLTRGPCPFCTTYIDRHGDAWKDGDFYHGSRDAHRCLAMAEAELAAATERLGVVRHWLAFHDNMLIAAGMQKACDDLAAALEVKP